MGRPEGLCGPVQQVLHKDIHQGDPGLYNKIKGLKRGIVGVTEGWEQNIMCWDNGVWEEVKLCRVIKIRGIPYGME